MVELLRWLAVIPVRLPADFAPPVVRDDCLILDGHPLHGTPCPVCDGPLGRLTGEGIPAPVALVAVGIRPENREDSGYVTGAAVAVHTACVQPEPQKTATPEQ